MTKNIKTENSFMSIKSISDLSELGKRIFQTNYSKKMKISEFTLSDLNNYIGADRKLVINYRDEFWIHDIVLTTNSIFFEKLLVTQEISPQKSEEVTIEGNLITKTYINLPHSEYFFDILTWLYSKDIKRLAFIADDQESYLSILSLGVFLGLKNEFFISLVSACEIKIDEKLINSTLWSRFQFPFEVLKLLVELLPKEKVSFKFFALLNWLKEKDISMNLNLNNYNDDDFYDDDVDMSELDLLTSDDFFKVKDYIKEKNICSMLQINDLIKMKKNYEKLMPILDYKYIFDKYIENPKMKITCRICRLQSNDIKIFEQKNCQEKLYHPKKFIQLQRQITSKCNHLDCNKKIAINEFPCCHQQNLKEGCLMSDGNHILSIH